LYGDRKFVTLFTKDHIVSIFWATCKSDVFPAHSLRFILILPYHLHQRLSRDLCFLGLPAEPLCEFPFASMRATCFAHLIFLNLIAPVMVVMQFYPWSC
jgi:hypothetical protein